MLLQGPGFPTTGHDFRVETAKEDSLEFEQDGDVGKEERGFGEGRGSVEAGVKAGGDDGVDGHETSGNGQGPAKKGDLLKDGSSLDDGETLTGGVRGESRRAKGRRETWGAGCRGWRRGGGRVS